MTSCYTPVAVILAILVLHTVAAQTTVRPTGALATGNTNAPAPVAAGLVNCTRNGQTCISVATCDAANHKCECPDGTHGEGTLECVPNDFILCTVDRDPHLGTWDRSRSPVDTPCWYGVTEFQTETCLVHVEALNRLTETGLFYVEEVSVELTALKEENGKRVPDADTLQHFVVTRNDALYAYDGDNPWNEITGYPAGGRRQLKQVWDDLNKFAILESAECGGVRIKYRPWVSRQFPQVNRPGVTVMAPENARFLHGDPEYVCKKPGDGPTVYGQLKRSYGFDRVSYVPIYEALGSFKSVIQRPECKAITKEFESCGANEVAAVNFCAPIWADQALRACINNNRDSLEKTYQACVAWVCGQQADACDVYFKAVTDCKPTDDMASIGCDLNKLTSGNSTFVYP